VVQDGEALRDPVHLEVSRASASAIAAVENRGGTITCVHFNRLALRALLKPQKFSILPIRARPPPKLMTVYLDYAQRGYLSPEVIQRNLKLFGYVTSEASAREAFETLRLPQPHTKNTIE
jgi:large subunit ribosomal protein L15